MQVAPSRVRELKQDFIKRVRRTCDVAPSRVRELKLLRIFLHLLLYRRTLTGA